MTEATRLHETVGLTPDPAKFGLECVPCFGLPLFAGSFDDAVSLLDALARWDAGAPVIVAHVNLANLHVLHDRNELRDRLARRAVLFLDGIGLKSGVAILGGRWVKDVNGTDLFPMLMGRLSRRRGRVYMLGALERVVEDATRATAARYPDVNIVGCAGGYFDAHVENDLVQRINAAEPDVLLVARGFGLQEEFVLRHIDSLQVPLIWTVGGLFDMISGHAPRAPIWMRRLRLEWLFRFAREPRRMWHRNIVSPPWFFAHVIGARLRLRRRAW